MIAPSAGTGLTAGGAVLPHLVEQHLPCIWCLFKAKSCLCCVLCPAVVGSFWFHFQGRDPSALGEPVGFYPCEGQVSLSLLGGFV